MSANEPPAPEASILVVDDEEVIRDVLGTLLARRGVYEVHLARDAQEAVSLLAARTIDLVLLDLFLPGTDGLDLLRQVRAEDPMREVIMITAHGSVASAVDAMRAGAFHYLTKPFQNDEVMLLVESALIHRRLRLENAGLRRALASRQPSGRLVGRSPAMQSVYQMIEQVAPARTTVLIAGESGTGKELVAQEIHRQSPRADAPFLTVNSSNLPAELLESNLFGHAKGAFTGASSDRVGLFEAAAGGTLFFDEISTIPLGVQSKLLRAIQEKEFLALGSVKPVRVDVRILVATNENLERLVREGTFREDLLYRLDVIKIELPPLRERRDDIPVLVEQFLAEFCVEHRREPFTVTVEAMHALVRYDWPGNVRQLRNVVERAVLLAPGSEIGTELIPEDIRMGRVLPATGRPLPAGLTFSDAIEEYERALIRWALDEAGGVQRRAAERLGMKPTTLNERMKRLGMRFPDPRGR
ncbi:MAG: sigma-54-dependent Fis family transcriptional regulator [Acidobacteria bacterium]|nr:sigma-54-dependent Fis family transcriptional regulator [Acidobacteriota bacterium]